MKALPIVVVFAMLFLAGCRTAESVGPVSFPEIERWWQS